MKNVKDLQKNRIKEITTEIIQDKTRREMITLDSCLGYVNVQKTRQKRSRAINPTEIQRENNAQVAMKVMLWHPQ